MNVLSLFDGMSCGQIALNRIGIKPDNYYASELDKYAITVTQANFPETKQLGDVTQWRDWDIDWASIDLLIGGSPCQGFSFAGKQLAFNDPRSALFFEYVNILNHIRKHNPDVKFLLENVKMKKQFLDVISGLLGVEPVFINSALVSAQNRQRFYWANWEFGQPGDKGLVLSDVVESSVDEKYLLSNRLLLGFESKINRRAAMKSGFDNFNVRPLGEKVSCITARYHKTAMSDPFVEVGTRDGCLVTVNKDSLPSYLPIGRHIDYEHKSYRRLTPTECERLQTVPDNYTAHVSNTQRYRMLGNGWTVDVVAHIFKSINT